MNIFPDSIAKVIATGGPMTDTTVTDRIKRQIDSITKELGDPHQLRHSAANKFSALGGSRTPNLLIRSQMLYPLSYERLGERV